jgi:hypothetical protein
MCFVSCGVKVQETCTLPVRAAVEAVSPVLGADSQSRSR